jgi:hypothetical protein
MYLDLLTPLVLFLKPTQGQRFAIEERKISQKGSAYVNLRICSSLQATTGTSYKLNKQWEEWTIKTLFLVLLQFQRGFLYLHHWNMLLAA